jgi:hypothetical protein
MGADTLYKCKVEYLDYVDFVSSNWTKLGDFEPRCLPPGATSRTVKKGTAIFDENCNGIGPFLDLAITPYNSLAHVVVASIASSQNNTKIYRIEKAYKGPREVPCIASVGQTCVANERGVYLERTVIGTKEYFVFAGQKFRYIDWREKKTYFEYGQVVRNSEEHLIDTLVNPSKDTWLYAVTAAGTYPNAYGDQYKTDSYGNVPRSFMYKFMRVTRLEKIHGPKVRQINAAADEVIGIKRTSPPVFNEVLLGGEAVFSNDAFLSANGDIASITRDADIANQVTTQRMVDAYAEYFRREKAIEEAYQEFVNSRFPTECKHGSFMKKCEEIERIDIVLCTNDTKNQTEECQTQSKIDYLNNIKRSCEIARGNDTLTTQLVYKGVEFIIDVIMLGNDSIVGDVILKCTPVEDKLLEVTLEDDGELNFAGLLQITFTPLGYDVLIPQHAEVDESLIRKIAKDEISENEIRMAEGVKPNWRVIGDDVGTFFKAVGDALDPVTPFLRILVIALAGAAVVCDMMSMAKKQCARLTAWMLAACVIIDAFMR